MSEYLKVHYKEWVERTIKEAKSGNIKYVECPLQVLETLQQENKHYKHIIDELEKWLEEEIKSWTEAINKERDYELVKEFAFKCNIYGEVLNKIKELKGVVNENKNNKG